MAEKVLNLTPSINGEVPTIGTLLDNIITDVATIRDNMKGGGLGVKSKTAYVNTEDGTTQAGDSADDNLDALAAASAKLPEYKGKLVKKLISENNGLGLITKNATLDKIVEAVTNIDKHNCESLATMQDGQGKYIPLGLGEAFAIPKGFHTGNVRIIALDNDECENDTHLNIGATKYTAPLPGDANLVINRTSVNTLDTNGNYVYEGQTSIKQSNYYGLTSVTIEPPDLEAMAKKEGIDFIAGSAQVLKGFGFVNESGLVEGTLESSTCIVKSEDLPAPRGGVKQFLAPDGLMYREVKISPIPEWYLDISDGGTEVTGLVSISSMKNQGIAFKQDEPLYVKSINIAVVNDIYEKLSKI